ncbi:MAG: DUF2723 domain-containing protein [Flavobacteriales bacterium]|nr:DUF2723 domain-containing protein [Flavobacteriales bacterium]
MEYKKLNNILGWSTFLVAAWTFLSTIEPTVSFWDCGEYIATAYKLEVGHPPGGPFFQMLGRLVTMFTPADKAALMINGLSAMCSAFTILFLFWTITALGKKLVERSGRSMEEYKWAILGSGVIGGLAYTWSDTFWFSAVEGEVYAMSSFFTAFVFWAILKWETIPSDKHPDRWIVLIAYLMGLSIGVHLLNLLTIPALAFVYYFKKNEVSRKGIIQTAIISFIILLGIQYGIVQYMIKIGAYFELAVVNGLGLPFGSGMLVYGLLITAGVVYGLKWTHEKNKPQWNTIILCFMMICIGYSSYGQIVVRSLANTPMDENNPENVFAFMSYLSREQYGDRPLGYGQYFNAPLDKREPYKDGNPVYWPDPEQGKYIVTDDKKQSIPNYDPKYKSVFPRMYSDKANHVRAYKEWSGFKGGNKRPSFGKNLTFFYWYQIHWMYTRYFLWNFAGRQNDSQGHGNILDGNWYTGIPFIDEIHLGPQDNLPASMTNNKAHNRLYGLPLLLGLLGLFFHFYSDKKGFAVVMILFLLTGLGIIVFPNQYPYQPRERDYAYAASFYAFAMWIGLGVMGLFELLKKYMPGKMSAITSVVVSAAVPAIMVSEEWDDHDRSGLYTARDFAANYLNSCEKNAILFTNGDNDTFPLWYAQEVEGIRTDVRVMNLSLSNTDWYIDQMSRKAYDSDPVPFSMKSHQYRQGTRDYVPFYERDIKGHTDLKEIMDFVKSESPQAKIKTQSGKWLNYIPTKNFSLSVPKEKVLANGTVSQENADKIVPKLIWTKSGNYVLKNSLMQLDMLQNNDWERPVYFAITVGGSAYLQMEKYFQLEGLAYRLVPIETKGQGGQTGRVDTDIMYNNVMNKFKWGGMDGDVYMGETNMRMTYNLRNNFARLADALLREGKTDSAITVLDKCVEVMPDHSIPYNFFMTPIAEAYYRAGEVEKANAVLIRLKEIYEDDLDYYLSLRGANAKSISQQSQRAMSVYQRLIQIVSLYKQAELKKEMEDKFKIFQADYQFSQPTASR